jgi:hypothetical protein
VRLSLKKKGKEGKGRGPCFETTKHKIRKTHPPPKPNDNKKENSQI